MSDVLITTQTAPSTAAVADVPSKTLQKILEAARECVLVIGADLRITNCNVPAAVAFGREELDIEGRRLSEIIRDLDLHEAFQRAFRQQNSSDVRLELNAGQRRFDVHVAPIELDGLPHAVGFFYETTQIDKLEIVRQEFLSNISHELRTPLTSILAFVETLEDGGLDDRENNHRFLAVIRRNAERMKMLIDDISELSMIESGRVNIDVRQVKLAPAVTEVMTALSSKAGERSITLENKIPDGVTIGVDSVRLEQMLTNLIDNAIKFNRQDGTVTVTHQSSPGNDLISVRDTGEGILPEHVGRIFERFYRADRARTREIGGTGLGLAIVKHLARLHGGEVSVTSELGVGTTFTIELPTV
jgi:two-component system phosphate regulon sensor histidine kinase PhoR